MNNLMTQLSEYRQMIVAVIALVITLLFALLIFLYCVILSPIRRMKAALKRVEGGDLHVRILPTWSREFQEIFGQFNQMTEKLERLIEQEYKLKLLNVKAELKQMRYQISPHFLYNAYFNMRAMLVDEDYDQAALMADLMGRYLRYVTTSGEDEATLAQELDHSVAYMKIQQLRFGERLETRVGPCAEQTLALVIPRIIIQPLIENAFEHGIKNQNGKGVISVEVEPHKDALRIIVDDNGQNASDEMIADVKQKLESGRVDAAGDSVALINISRRIQLLYRKGSGLFVSRSPLGGFRSEIVMIGVTSHVSNADRG